MSSESGEPRVSHFLYRLAVMIPTSLAIFHIKSFFLVLQLISSHIPRRFWNRFLHMRIRHWNFRICSCSIRLYKIFLLLSYWRDPRIRLRAYCAIKRPQRSSDWRRVAKIKPIRYNVGFWFLGLMYSWNLVRCMALIFIFDWTIKLIYSLKLQINWLNLFLIYFRWVNHDIYFL